MDGYLRAASEADMDILFEWANEPSVRKNSFSTKEVSYGEHVNWFHKLMENPNARQYIYMYEGKKTGQIRMTVSGKTAEIGYSVCKDKRGQGHGRSILKLICGQVKQDFPQVEELLGKVKPGNTASREAFLGAGFWEDAADRGLDYVIYKNRYE